MSCEIKIISKTNNGKVYICTRCDNRLAVMFGNISQSYTEYEFLEFKTTLEQLDIENYFSQYTQDEKIYLRTELNNLFFSFTKSEIYELRKLLSDAHFKYKILSDVRNNLN